MTRPRRPAPRAAFAPAVMTTLAAALAAALAAGCNGTRVDLAGDKALQRMIDQPRYDVYQGSELFADGKAMQAAPVGTIAREQLVNRPALTDPDSATTEIPVPVTPQLLALGETQFNIYCAACHGPGGFGAALTAIDMRIRPPANLMSDSVRALPPGATYRVVTRGYRWMPPMAPYMSVTERWAVTAYLKTLQANNAEHVTPLPGAPAEARRRGDSGPQAEGATEPRPVVVPQTVGGP